MYLCPKVAGLIAFHTVKRLPFLLIIYCFSIKIY